MSVEFVDGFDHYQMILQKWDIMAATGLFPFINPTVGRNGGGALQFPLDTNSNAACYVTKNIPTSATKIFGLAVWLNQATATADSILLCTLDGASTQVDLRVDVTGKFFFTRNGTLLGSKSVSTITFRTWHYVEVKITVDPSAGVAILNVDGSNTGWLNLTSQNTRASGVSQMTGVRLGSVTGSGAQSWTTFIDDFYMFNTSGSLNNAFIGDSKVTGVMPTGDGSTLNYTMNAAAWVASTLMWIGRSVLDSNGNIQRITAVTSDAKTGGGVPTWNVSVNGTTTDNHVTWTNLGAQSQFLTVNENPIFGIGQRLTNTAYIVGNAVWDTNGNIQVCTTAGTTANIFSGGQNAAWNLTVGGTTGDGSVVWTNKGVVEDLYLSDAVVSDISRFTFPSVTASAVNAVVVNMWARKDDPGTRSIRGAAKSSGTTGDSGTDLPLSTTYQILQGIFETDPHTSAAWSPSAANSAEFGIKTTA